MEYTAKQIEKKAKDDEKANRELIRTLKKKPPRDLDQVVQSLHDLAFEKIDCLSCANCCRSLGPRITDKDIERLSRHLKIKPSLLVQTYLKLDEDQDYVFSQMPCPFLEEDNKCRVYEQRPKACREYPHTDRKKFHQILDLTLKNSYVCPAVTQILGDLRVWKSKS
jgi:Fe-S-cluster containining protein